jgi:hypothetical protein
MPRFLLHHRHEPEECGVAFTSFKGHASPLRHSATVASSLSGSHEIWWLVDAPGPGEALAYVPQPRSERSRSHDHPRTTSVPLGASARACPSSARTLPRSRCSAWPWS